MDLGQANVFVVECNLLIIIHKPGISEHMCIRHFFLFICGEFTPKVCTSISESPSMYIDICIHMSDQSISVMHMIFFYRYVQMTFSSVSCFDFSRAKGKGCKEMCTAINCESTRSLIRSLTKEILQGV